MRQEILIRATLPLVQPSLIEEAQRHRHASNATMGKWSQAQVDKAHAHEAGDAARISALAGVLWHCGTDGPVCGVLARWR